MYFQYCISKEITLVGALFSSVVWIMSILAKK